MTRDVPIFHKINLVSFFGQDYAAFAAQVEKNFNRLFVKAAAYETMQ